MKEEKTHRVEFHKEQWENLQAKKPYSEKISHLFDHENIWYWCYQTKKRAGMNHCELLNNMEFFVCWN